MEKRKVEITTVTRARSANAGFGSTPGARLRATAILATAFALVGAGLWWLAARPARELRSAGALLADAYSRQRTFEFRLPAASYSPVHAEARDEQGFTRPISLLEAESRIVRHLAKDHDNTDWLRLRAHAEMLDADPEAAIATLHRSLEARPEDPDLLADLGVAYGLRADAQNRDVDLGYAIDYLCRSLKAKPNSPVATFNRAVVYERTYLYEDAIGEWRRYLELEPASGWRDEARRRLAELERKKEARLRKLAQTSDKDPEALLRLLDVGQQIDAESYLDVAVVDWLPRLGQDSQYERALSALASRLEKQHRDRWLRDVLASRSSRQSIRGFVALSDAVRANLASESDLALEKSAEAQDRLRAAGNEAGALRADFEQVYAHNHARLPVSQCVAKAAALDREAVARSYYWIAGQALLEQGNCRSVPGDFGSAQNNLARSLQLIRHAGYQDIELRAAGILAEVQTEAGNLLAAWSVGRMGLEQYWSGSYSGTRAHQIYFDLMRSAEGLGLRQAAYVFGSALAMAIAETPRRRTEATNRAYLAELAMEVGRPDRARTEFDQASVLFEQLQDSGREYRTVAELCRAQAEMAGGDLPAALRRLEAMRPSAENVSAAAVRISYEQALADSLRLSGRPDDAEAAYRRTTDLIGDRLHTLRGTRDRAQLVLAASGAYRGLVGLLWQRGDLAGSWRLWESFRTSDRNGELGEPDLDQRRARLRNESFLSYVMLPNAIVAWVFDDRGVEGLALKMKPEDVETVASRFLRECADPASDRNALRRDARLLYDGLVAPVAGRLDPARTLVIEPDGAVGAIPMQALIDPSFHYVGERFAITVASGLADYQIRGEVGPVGVGARALIVANPRLGEKMTKTFPPLPEAMREGRTISARLHASTLLAGEQATLAALEQHRADTELLHFAGHGFSNAGNGGLLLSLPDGGAEGVGVLDGNAMAQQDWSRCRLAVLSACSTGTGETRGPVNPESLVRGLLWAGVARVVASRWNTDSETGVPFMDQFYTDLLGGKEVAAALQHAAKALREKEATSHPYYWAGFQSFGTR